jgi:hypothetical protein
MIGLTHVWRFGLILAFLASFSGGAQAQVANSATPGQRSEAGTVTGEVTDLRGTPLAGTSVIVTTPGGKQVASSTTDAGGIFRVVDLQPGDYVLAVDAKGFYKKTEKIKIKPQKTEKTHIKMKFIPLPMD